MFKTNFSRGILAVIGSILIDVSVGEFNLLGFLYPYFVSYLRLFNPGLKVEDMRIIPMCWQLAQIVFSPLGLYIATKIGFRPTFLIFILFFCTVQWICSYIRDFKLFGVVFGLSGGAAQGALLILPIYCCWRYFEERHKPKVSGTVLSAFAVAPLLTSQIALFAINPSNAKQTVVEADGAQYFDTQIANRVPFFLRMFSIVCALMGCLGTLMILDPIESKEEEVERLVEIQQQPPTIDNKEKSSDLKPFDNKAAINSVDDKQFDDRINNIKMVGITEFVQSLGEPLFLSLFIGSFISFCFIHILNFTFKTIGLKCLKDDAFVTFVGSIGAVINGASRFVVGLIFQHYGYLPVGLSILVIQFSISLTYLWLAHSKLTYFLATSLYEVSFGFVVGLGPLLLDQFYKNRGAMIFSYSQSATTLAVIFSLTGYSYIKMWYGELVSFMVLAVMILFSIPVIIIIARADRQTKRNDTELGAPK